MLLAEPGLQAMGRRSDLSDSSGRNAVNFRPFCRDFRRFSGQNAPFSRENRSFSRGHYSHCGTLCAFLRTSRIFPESAFCVGKTRGFFPFLSWFSALGAHKSAGFSSIFWGVGGWVEFLFSNKIGKVLLAFEYTWHSCPG